MAMTDCDPPAVYRSAERTARKARDCTECGRQIQPGETYQAVTGLWDRTWWRFSTCAHCVEVAAWFAQVTGEVCHGAIGEYLPYEWDWHRQANLGRLVILIRRRWAGVTPQQVRHWARTNREYRSASSGRVPEAV